MDLEQNAASTNSVPITAIPYTGHVHRVSVIVSELLYNQGSPTAAVHLNRIWNGLMAVMQPRSGRMYCTP